MAIEFFLSLMIIDWILFYFKYFDLNMAIFFTIFLLITWIIYIYRWKEELKKEGREEDESKKNFEK
ncbi:MAG: hypothetical protein ACP5JU_01490 [Minisyncoccia bacterium]